MYSTSSFQCWANKSGGRHGRYLAARERGCGGNTRSPRDRALPAGGPVLQKCLGTAVSMGYSASTKKRNAQGLRPPKLYFQINVRYRSELHRLQRHPSWAAARVNSSGNNAECGRYLMRQKAATPPSTAQADFRSPRRSDLKISTQNVAYQKIRTEGQPLQPPERACA